MKRSGPAVLLTAALAVSTTTALASPTGGPAAGAGATPSHAAAAPRAALAGRISAPARTFKVSFAQRGGGTIHEWGYDIKQARAAEFLGDKQLGLVRARAIFGNRKMALLRIPVHAETGWVDGNGMPIYQKYVDERIVHAVRNAVSVNHDLVLYVNRVSVPHAPNGWYDKSLKTDGKVSMYKYAAFLVAYVRFIDKAIGNVTTSSGGHAHVQIVAPDNERMRQANEGHISGPRFVTLARILHQRLGAGLKLAATDNGKGDLRWLRQARQLKAPWRQLTYATLHYQSQLRTARSTKRPFRQFSQLARLNRLNGRLPNLQPWDTEFHWADTHGKITNEYYDDARAGLLAGFDHTDQHYSGVVFWSFASCRTGALHYCKSADSPISRAELQSALVDSTSGERAVSVADGDGRFARPGTVTTRAFVAGNVLHVWIVNDTRQHLRKRHISVGQRRVSAGSFERWTRRANGQISGESHGLTGRSRGDAVLNVPPHSMTLLTLTMS